ncbi:hypothetical protein [Nostoc sp. UHCC 0302]
MVKRHRKRGHWRFGIEQSKISKALLPLAQLQAMDSLQLSQRQFS